MQLPDLNLLPALDALLREGSVTGAARRLSLSTPAMSRALGRLRRVTGDPLLVPAGRGLVPTPAALALRPHVAAALAAALAVLEPAQDTDLATLARTVTVRTDDAVVAVLGPALTGRAAREAPGVRLRFVPEGDEDPAALRATVDLDIGALGPQPPDVRVEPLLTEDLVGVVHAGHPLADGPVDLERFAATPQVMVSRRGVFDGPIDDLLAGRGMTRTVSATVPGFAAAAFTALGSDALAVLPRTFARHCATTVGLRIVEIPLGLPTVAVAQAWHQRLDADPAHRWLRRAVAQVTRSHELPGAATRPPP